MTWRSGLGCLCATVAQLKLEERQLHTRIAVQHTGLASYRPEGALLLQNSEPHRLHQPSLLGETLLFLRVAADSRLTGEMFLCCFSASSVPLSLPILAFVLVAWVFDSSALNPTVST